MVEITGSGIVRKKTVHISYNNTNYMGTVDTLFFVINFVSNSLSNSTTSYQITRI